MSSSASRRKKLGISAGLGVAVIVAVLLFIVSSSIVSYAGVLDKLQRDLENAQSEQEIEMILEEFTDTRQYKDACLSLFNEMTELKDKGIDSNSAEFLELGRIYSDLGCLFTIEKWNPEVIAQSKKIQQELDKQKISLEECIELRDRYNSFLRDYYEELDKGQGIADEFVLNRPDSSAKHKFVEVHRCHEYYPDYFLSDEPIFETRQ